MTQLVDKADRQAAWQFLELLLKAFPDRIHTILTDRAIGTPLIRGTRTRHIQLAELPRNRNIAYFWQMQFDMICGANEIEHRLTEPNHPWINGQVERMNRTIKEATVKRLHFENLRQLRTYIADFIAAYDFARRSKTLSELTPYVYNCNIWA